MAQKQESGVEQFSRQTVMLILHIMRNIRSVKPETYYEIELSYPQILMLYALVEHGTITMGELSRWLKISHGVATRTVDRLVEKGLVERRHSDDDRRVVLVTPSKEGKEFAEKTISDHIRKLNVVFDEMTDEQKRSFIESLKQIDSRLEE